MEQLTLIQIFDNGEVNIVAEVKFNEDHGKGVNKEIVRKHLTKIVGLLFNKEVKVFYHLKEIK